MKEVICPKCMITMRTNQEIKFRCKKCHGNWSVERCLVVFLDEMLQEIWAKNKTTSFFRA